MIDRTWIGVGSPWMRFKCWLLHGRSHSVGSDDWEGAIYNIRFCHKCHLAVPTAVFYRAPSVHNETEDA